MSSSCHSQPKLKNSSERGSDRSALPLRWALLGRFVTIKGAGFHSSSPSSSSSSSSTKTPLAGRFRALLAFLGVALFSFLGVSLLFLVLEGVAVLEVLPPKECLLLSASSSSSCRRDTRDSFHSCKDNDKSRQQNKGGGRGQRSEGLASERDSKGKERKRSPVSE